MQTFAMPCNRLSMVLWNIDGAEATLNGSLVYWYCPFCVLIVRKSHPVAVVNRLGANLI